MFKALLTLALLAAPVAAHAAPDATGHVATGSGASIYFERYGQGANIVLIPGRLFLPEFASLAGPERTLIMYDMRNRGLSRRIEDVAQITIMHDVEDLEAMRRHFGAEKVSLVGYSYLGLMVAIYTSQHSDRVERVVQIGPLPRKLGTSFPADQMAGSDSLSAEGKAAEAAWNNLLANFEKPDFKIDPKAACAVFQLYSSYRLVGNPANRGKVADTCQYENEMLSALNRHFPALFGDLQGRDIKRESFTALKQPVLTLHGTIDRNAPYGSGLEWATTFPNGRLITVEGGAHQLWLDDPNLIADIDSFLEGKWPARAQRFGRD